LANTGVQKMLDAVVDYFPNPAEVPNFALDRRRNEVEVSLAFKLEEELSYG